jgi:hypothetical protein
MTVNKTQQIVRGDRRHGFGREKGVYWRDGVYAKEDYRYWAMYEYLKLSPSFIAVWSRLENVTSPYPLPEDADIVEPVVKDFRHIFGMPAWKWWGKHGKYLFGTTAPGPQVIIAGRLSEKNKALTVPWDRNDAVIARIAVNQSKQDALKELEVELDRLIAKRQFSVATTDQSAPKYVFLNNRIREATLAVGSEVLTYYCMKRVLPLWWIGNLLGVIPGQCFERDDLPRMATDELAQRKRVLSIATSRIIRTSLLIAENAARGRFPCASPFPQAMVSVFERKAGRPTKEKTDRSVVSGANRLQDIWR